MQPNKKLKQAKQRIGKKCSWNGIKSANGEGLLESATLRHILTGSCASVFGTCQGIGLSSLLLQREEVNCDHTYTNIKWYFNSLQILLSALLAFVVGSFFHPKEKNSLGVFLNRQVFFSGRMFGDKGHRDLIEELGGMEAAFIHVYLCAYSLIALLRKAILSSALIKK